MTTVSLKGDVGEVTVEITAEGPDPPVEHLAMDLKGRCEELRQMVEDGTDPDETDRPVSIRWRDVLEDLEVAES